jgi:hypothetical protein
MLKVLKSPLPLMRVIHIPLYHQDWRSLTWPDVSFPKERCVFYFFELHSLIHLAALSDAVRGRTAQRSVPRRRTREGSFRGYRTDGKRRRQEVSSGEREVLGPHKVPSRGVSVGTSECLEARTRKKLASFFCHRLQRCRTIISQMFNFHQLSYWLF